jgi:DNA-binding MarR family transcriptional regulator
MIEALYRSAGHLIRRAHQLHDTVFGEVVARFDITSPQYAALLAIAEFPGLEQGALSELIAYDRSTIGGLIDRLEGKDLVRRTIGARDRRTRLLSLTPAGATMLRKLRQQTPLVQQRLLSPLSPSERELFLEMLGRVVNISRSLERLPGSAGGADRPSDPLGPAAEENQDNGQPSRRRAG